MTTISTRVDEKLKERAEQIADSIGLSLSAAINVFLRRFVVEEGFPFQLKAPNTIPKQDIVSMSTSDITELVRQGILEATVVPKTPFSAYIDPVTKRLVTHDS